MKVQDVWVQNGRKESPRQEEIERTTRLQIKTVTRTSKCRLTCIFAWQQPSKILLSDSDVFFWRRAPKIHARQLLEQHTLAQDKRGSKARPEASSNSKECLEQTPVVKSRFQVWDASETFFVQSKVSARGPLSKQMMKRGRSLATPCRQGQRSATAMCRSCTRKHRALSNTGEGFKQRPKNCDYSPAHEKQTKEKKSKAPAPEKRGGEAKQASPPNLGIPRKFSQLGAPQGCRPPNLRQSQNNYKTIYKTIIKQSIKQSYKTIGNLRGCPEGGAPNKKY